MADEPRSTALDPDLLTSEIGLLLDHLSGRREPMTTARQQGQMPLGSATYDDALSRYFSIDEKVRRGETLPAADLQFLLQLRDYLNDLAAPATGASIAFTTLVLRKSPEARKGKADAERAYPEWIPMARALRGTMVGLLCIREYPERGCAPARTNCDMRRCKFFYQQLVGFGARFQCWNTPYACLSSTSSRCEAVSLRHGNI